MVTISASLPYSRGYGGAVIDYVAGSDEGQIPDREKLYRYNQIPAIVVGPKDLDKPGWDTSLYERLEQAYRHAFDQMRYRPLPAAK